MALLTFSHRFPWTSAVFDSRIYGAEHPVDQREVADGVQKGQVGTPLQQQDDGVQRRLGPEVGSQRNNEVVDAVGGKVGSQDDGLVLPAVLLG